MPGILGVLENNYISDCPFQKNQKPNLICNKITFQNLFVEQRSVNKFLNDKIFIETEQQIIILDGIILNSKELCRIWKKNNFQETIIEMAQREDSFFTHLHGSFTGLLYSKKKYELLIFTDQIGSKQMYYSTTTHGQIIFGSEINYIIEYYQQHNKNYSLNTNAAYFLLTLGFTVEDNTLFHEIKRLKPGCFLKYTYGKVQIIQYYKLRNTPNNNLKEKDIVEQVDFLFRQAVKEAFEKDKEYNYKHLVGLSAGLDTRMVNWVAHDLGYSNNIVNYTFSQSNYWDETTSKQIATKLKHEWIFKNLDNGLCLKRIEDTVNITSGNALYSAQSHTKSCLDLINTDQFGIIHSGQLGDVILGTYYSTKKIDKKITLKTGGYSGFLSKRLNLEMFHEEYENEEIFKFYTRGFTGMNQGLLILQEYSETYSPFYNLDFMEFCLSIPLKLRIGHYMYDKWITTKYPAASLYPHNAGRKIGGVSIPIGNKRINVMNIPSRALEFIHNLRKPLASPKHMNPFDYWYNTNDDIKQTLDSYYKENINRLYENSQLLKDCEEMYQRGSTIEKTQILTLLAVMRLYF